MVLVYDAEVDKFSSIEAVQLVQIELLARCDTLQLLLFAQLAEQVAFANNVLVVFFESLTLGLQTDSEVCCLVRWEREPARVDQVAINSNPGREAISLISFVGWLGLDFCFGVVVLNKRVSQDIALIADRGHVLVYLLRAHRPALSKWLKHAI